MLLSPEEITQALEGLGSPWEVEREQLCAVFSLASYVTGLDLVARIGMLAERMDHHPVITLEFARLRVAITTHDVGGLTSLDVTFARECSALVDEHTA